MVHRIVFILIGIIVCFTGICFSVEEEKFTITTYYPSPTGVYQTLRIVPSATPSDCNNPLTAPLGKMYYNQNDKSLYICSAQGSSAGYQLVPGGNGAWAINGNMLYVLNTTMKVGIQTNNPIFPLDVGGYVHIAGNSTPLVSTQGSYWSWNALTGGTGETDFINNRGSGAGGFAFMNTTPSGAPGTAFMFINGTGSVGIGTTTPQANLEVNGTIKSPKWNVSIPIAYSGAGYPRSGSFTSNGGTLMIHASGTAYRSAAGIMRVDVRLDGTSIGEMKAYTNEVSSHKTLNPRIIVLSGIAAGSHTITLVLVDGSADANDFSQVVVEELPY